MNAKTKACLRALPLLAALGAAGAAHAADGTNTLNQSVWLRIGAFHPDISSNARVDHPVTGASGTEVEFEDLGLPKKKTFPTLLLGARFGDGWRAEFEYFQLKRSGVTTLGQLLNFDDTTFPVQASLATSFRSDVYRASLGYSFVHTPQAEVGAVFGLHVTHFDIGLVGTVGVQGQQLTTQAEQKKQTVPLPTLGLYGAFVLAPGWEATGRVDVFSLRHNQYDGRLINAQANVIYRVSSNVGLGLGYRYDDYRLNATKDDFHGHLEYKFKGPQAFLEVGF